MLGRLFFLCFPVFLFANEALDVELNHTSWIFTHPTEEIYSTLLSFKDREVLFQYFSETNLLSETNFTIDRWEKVANAFVIFHQDALPSMSMFELKDDRLIQILIEDHVQGAQMMKISTDDGEMEIPYLEFSKHTAIIEVKEEKSPESINPSPDVDQ
ncbi:MAG: hypothetical protein ACRCS8_05550 [Brevinema sp.]